jgi:hypothetical protein
MASIIAASADLRPHGRLLFDPARQLFRSRREMQQPATEFSSHNEWAMMQRSAILSVQRLP